MHTDVKTWPQLLFFRQPMTGGHPSGYFVVAVFVSVVMHGSLLSVVATVRTAVKPAVASIGTPMIVSLVSLPSFDTASHDGTVSEAVSALTHTGPSSQPSQSSPERPRSAEGKTEVEFVATSEGQEVPASEAPEGKSFTTGINPSVDLETAYSIEREVGRMSESEDGTIVTSKGQWVLSSEAPEGKFFATDGGPSIDLEAAYSIAREVGREWGSMSALKTQSPRFTSRELYLKNHLGIIKTPRSDCRTEYAEKGFLAIPYLLRDAINDSGCTWERQESRGRQWDRERQGDPGRLGFYFDEIINLGREK